MSQCVFCGETANLNTELSVSMEDGTKVRVLICDAHAEDATIKTARVAYLDKKKKIDAVLEQAKALGLNITGVQQQGSLLVPTVARPQSPIAISAPLEPIEPQDLSGDGVVTTELLDGRRGMQSVGGSTDFGHVPGMASHDLTSFASKLPEGARNGKAKMTVVEGREGQPLAIPETRVDGTGTTRLRISKKEDDTKLQARFKKMANESIQRDGSHNFARDGYQNTQATCPICRGAQTIKQSVGGVVRDVQCPKCNGFGTISLV